ncbi:MAG: PIG-L family deacetylase [Flavobacteriales bacterium]|nr:PIG-L family deacetylase [Flavobacteriales bacterium]
MTAFFRTLLFSSLLVSFKGLAAQPQKQWSGAEILHELQKMQVVGKVLYVAAHPDDENTRLITWLANHKKLETAYISLTRGDGGQNLIGNELDAELGLIRTHELWQARGIDGGKQFFSRAHDFGYSKSSTETFKIWKKDVVLSDLVWVIRKFQPDIIITRFSPEPSRTHGHHTASAMLAVQSMELLTDTNIFYEQFPLVQVWKPKRVIWNTSSFFFENEKQFNKDTFPQLNVGDYNALLGASYTEIAALSRSQHKSQGFGSSGARGETMEYFVQLAGDKMENKDVFSGINTSWSRYKGGDVIQKKIASILLKYQVSNPSAIIDDLFELYGLIQKLPDQQFIGYKLEALRNLIKQCMGLFAEVTTSDYIYALGDSIRFNIELINRSGKKLTYVSLRLKNASRWLQGDFQYNKSVQADQLVKASSQGFVIRTDARISNPWWFDQPSLKSDPYAYMNAIESRWNEDMMVVLEPSFDNKPASQSFMWEFPLWHKKNDPVKGEIYKPVYIAPPVTASPLDPLLFFGNDQSKDLQIQLEAFKARTTGYIDLELPEGWQCHPNKIMFEFSTKRDKHTIGFKIIPPAGTSSGIIKIRVHTAEGTFSYAFREISYDHIPHLVYFPSSEVKVVKQPVQCSSSLIGYLEGAGDDVDRGLAQLGYSIEYIDAQHMQASQLQKYKAVVVGIRAFNTYENSSYINKQLCDYVQQGGVVVMQYITTSGMKTKQIGPYRLNVGRDRVTEEQALVKITSPGHRLFSIPNVIDSTDWNGWIQERGLYFASAWDSTRVQSLLAMSDSGEEPRLGALLVAPYGKGVFIYTGLSFFRQIPAGIPGAYKLLVNLIEFKP